MQETWCSPSGSLQGGDGSLSLFALRHSDFMRPFLPQYQQTRHSSRRRPSHPSLCLCPCRTNACARRSSWTSAGACSFPRPSRRASRSRRPAHQRHKCGEPWPNTTAAQTLASDVASCGFGSNVLKEGFKADFKRPRARPPSAGSHAFTNKRHASSPFPDGKVRMTVTASPLASWARMWYNSCWCNSSSGFEKSEEGVHFWWTCPTLEHETQVGEVPLLAVEGVRLGGTASVEHKLGRH